MRGSDSRKWLANHFGTTQKNIDNVLRDEKATTFLLIWPIMEQELFDGFMKNDHIESKAAELEKYYERLDLDTIIEAFWRRYQDKDNFRHLLHKDKNGSVTSMIKQILSTPLSNLNNKEKLELLLFIIYRYRNNIFHGNKGVLSWTKYSEQINSCIFAMTRLIDIQKQEC